jgi:hypothetical protein
MIFMLTKKATKKATKTISIRGAAELQFDAQHPDDVGSPISGGKVSSPFTADGDLDAGATDNTVTLISLTTGQVFSGTPVPPPDGANWAFEFTVPTDTYKLKDVENGGGTYVVKPIYVS